MLENMPAFSHLWSILWCLPSQTLCRGVQTLLIGLLTLFLRISSQMDFSFSQGSLIFSMTKLDEKFLRGRDGINWLVQFFTGNENRENEWWWWREECKWKIWRNQVLMLKKETNFLSFYLQFSLCFLIPHYHKSLLNDFDFTFIF